MPVIVKNRIDSASLYQLVQSFTYHRTTEWTGWDRSVALSLTAVLVGAPEFSIGVSPSPEAAGEALGPYGLLVDMMRKMGVVRDETIDPTLATEALRRAKWIATDRAPEIQQLYHRLLNEDIQNFRPWLQWAISHAWIEHSQRLGGLFNQSMIPEISLVLQRPEDDLLRALRASQNSSLVRRFSAQGDLSGGEEFELIRDAYSVSALIRGLYHAAVHSSDHVIQHPLRRLLRVTEGPPLGSFTVDREHLLSSIIVNSAVMVERNEEKRLAHWAENVKRARAAHIVGRMPRPIRERSEERTQQLDQESYGYDKQQWARIVELVREAEIAVYPDWRDTLFDIGVPLTLGVGATGVSELVLNGWAAFLTTSAAAVATTAAAYAWAKDPKRRIGPTIYTRSKKLQELVRYPPGQVIM